MTYEVLAAGDTKASVFTFTRPEYTTPPELPVSSDPVPSLYTTLSTAVGRGRGQSRSGL